jgi:hypothetical protein
MTNTAHKNTKWQAFATANSSASTASKQDTTLGMYDAQHETSSAHDQHTELIKQGIKIHGI